MAGTAPYGLFEVFGVELEYMIVDAATLDVRPCCDTLLEAVGGTPGDGFDPEGTDVSWSNELALHVVEFKTREPVAALPELHARFAAEVARANHMLANRGCGLLPGGVHPWMDPLREMRLWPHECGEIYAAFDRIFSCKGHGWANLQSTHLNLPFRDETEFVLLHSAIRALLPLLPALAASSPVLDGKPTGLADSRLEVYRGNCARVPSVTGLVVPEPVRSTKEYRKKILERIYRDLAPHDPEGVLRDEWANARGAIARFSRGSIEIRVLDIQECPRADLAILELVVAVLRRLCKPELLETLLALPTENLHRILTNSVRLAGAATVDDAAYLALFGLDARPRPARELWEKLLENVSVSAEAGPALQTILGEGTLADRMLRFLGDAPDHDRLRALCRRLAGCLAENRQFRA